MSNMDELVFSYATTPHISVILSIKISTRVPVIYKPFILNKEYYGDGAILNNFPINYCNKENAFGIVSIVKGSTNYNSNPIIKKIVRIYHNYNMKIVDLYKINNYNIIIIPFNKEPLLRYINIKNKEIVFCLLYYGECVTKNT